MGDSCLCIYLYMYIIFSFWWNYHFTVMILYIIMNGICLQGIDGSRARVVFIQIAKCADPRACTMGHVGSEYMFCLKCSHCRVYFDVLELLQPVTPGNPLSRSHWPASGPFGSRQHDCHDADNIFIRNLLNEYIEPLIQFDLSQVINDPSWFK